MTDGWTERGDYNIPVAFLSVGIIMSLSLLVDMTVNITNLNPLYTVNL